MQTFINLIKSLQATPVSLFIGIVALLIFCSCYATWRFAHYLRNKEIDKRQSELEDEHFKTQKGLKQIYDSEKEKMITDRAELEQEIEALKARSEDYRRKVAGLGVFSFLPNNKKRTDILYSLLLENEMLEQLLLNQNKRIIDQSNQHLKEKIIDIGKRQRLMSEIFNDEKIKNYVEDVLKSDRLTTAEDYEGETDAVETEQDVKLDGLQARKKALKKANKK